MKGIELPINVLVVVAIAVIVLLGVVILYFIGWNPFSTAVGVEGAKNAACGEEMRSGCSIYTNQLPTSGFDANKDGQISPARDGVGAAYTPFCGASGNDNFAQLCVCYYNRVTEASCRALCGCPGYS